MWSRKRLSRGHRVVRCFGGIEGSLGGAGTRRPNDERGEEHGGAVLVLEYCRPNGRM